MNKKENLPRVETKFVCNHMIGHSLYMFFKKHGFVRAYEDRNVHSVYFDDCFLTSAQDNLAGITPRSKLRFRWYSDTSLNAFGWRFEEKIKKDFLGYKNVFEINDPIKKIINTDLVTKANSIKIKCRTGNVNNLKPILFCAYKRSYFENRAGVRLTIDNNLKFKRVTSIKFGDGTNGLLMSNMILLELKYSLDQLNDVKQINRKIPVQASRCSKYLIGLSKTRGMLYI